MKQITLTQDKVALVDDADFEWLSRWKWRARKCGMVWYACRNSPRPEHQTIYMHREILGDSWHIDHKDGDGLNNQRQNLRSASKQQNGQNSGLRKNNTSGFKGVSHNRKLNKWVAQIQVGERSIYLGVFATAEESALAYDKAAVEHCGDFARLNFPERLEPQLQVTHNCNTPICHRVKSARSGRNGAARRSR